MDNKIYIALQYAKGGELYTFIKENAPLSENCAKNYFEQMLSAVSYIHKKKIIHRDIKPQNVLFVDETKKDLVLIDFGIAGQFADNIVEKVMAGTLTFLAPEVISGKFESSPQLDVWSLGVILYMMLFGKLPFLGGTKQEIKKNIEKKEVEFPGEISVSRMAKKVILAMLEKDPKKRINSDNEIFEAWFEDR